jgi:hypothetical protein
MKKKVKKLVLAKETVAALLPEVTGGATINCTQYCPTGPVECQSGKYPC